MPASAKRALVLVERMRINKRKTTRTAPTAKSPPLRKTNTFLFASEIAGRMFSPISSGPAHGFHLGPDG
jgi:hypothetical protein